VPVITTSGHHRRTGSSRPAKQTNQTGEGLKTAKKQRRKKEAKKKERSKEANPSYA
jgi:hypothetical protein